MIFKLQANCEFEAEGIIDAMNKLAEHFRLLANGEDSDLLLGGSITVERFVHQNYYKPNGVDVGGDG